MTTWTASPPQLPDMIPEGYILRSFDIDIADTYPKGINVTYREADEYVKRFFSRKFSCADWQTVYFSFDWDQSVITTIDRLIEANYGIGRIIEYTERKSNLTRFYIKFKTPVKWNITHACK